MFKRTAKQNLAKLKIYINIFNKVSGISRNKCLWVLMGNVLIIGILKSVKATAIEKHTLHKTCIRIFTAALL